MVKTALIRAGIVVALLLVGFGALSAQDGSSRSATAVLTNADNEQIGVVTFSEVNSTQIVVSANIRDLEPGWHGFHIHSVGMCTPHDDMPFTDAAGHLTTAEGQQHPNHAGDLPSLFVMADGTAMMAFVTDNFSFADLLDADGAAVMVHANADNFANIPARYGDDDAEATAVPDPMVAAPANAADEETRRTGDSGARVACGVIAADTPSGSPATATAVPPTAEATMEMTPEVTPESTMEMTPEVTAEPTNEQTPEVTVAPTIEPTIEPTSEATPEVTASA